MRTTAGLVAGSSILLGSALVGGQAAPAPSPGRPSAVATGSTLSAAVKLAALPAAGAVPSHFEPASVSFVTTSLGFVLGTSPCTRAPCTDLVSTSDGGRHWVELSAPRAALAVSAGGVPATGQRAVSKVVFANASDGVAYGPGLWSTTDGAATWSQVHIGRPVLTLAASGGFAEAVVESCDPQSARCSAPALHLERAAIGSGSWHVVAGVTGYSESLLSLHASAGWVAMWPKKPYGAAPAIWHTTDAGATWKRVPDHCFEPAQATDLAAMASPGGSLLFELCAGNPGAGQEGKEVLASTDGGATTHLAGRPPLGGLALGLAVASRRVLVVSASSGASVLYRSTNGGHTWTTSAMLSDGGAGLSDLAFVSPTEGVVIDGHPADAPFPDALLMTRDAGHTWSAVPISASPPAPVGQPSTAARIGPHAVWRGALRGQAAAAEACIFSRRPTPSSAQVKSCIARYMRAHGASTAAVAYFEATGSYLISFVDTGRIDVGYTLSEEPMDCGCFGYVLLNGAHQYLVLPAPSLASPAYAKLRRAYRLPSGHTGLSYLYFPPFLESARKRAGGGEDLIFQFVLNDVCNACATPYRARAAYLFSSVGALVGSVSLGPCLGPQPKGSAAGKVDVKEPACPPTRAGPPR